MAYSFDAFLAADPSNPANVAANAAITIFDPADPTHAPVTITDLTGLPLTNPVTVNKNGFGPAFMHATLDRVAWEGAGFEGLFTSYEGMKAEAVAARVAAENAASDAGAEAAAAVAPVIADAQAATAAANTAATNALAPTDAAIAGYVTGAGPTKAALSATYGKVSFVDVEDFRNIGGTDASDDVCIQKAIAHANANSIPVVKLTREAYTTRKQINMAGVYNVCVEGLGRDQTVITVPGTLADINVALGSAFTATGSAGGCGNLTFRNFTVQGTIVDDTNGIPRRSRTNSGGAGVSQAFTFRGDLQPLANGSVDPNLYAIRDIRIDNVRVAHTNTLPFLLSGVRGDASVTNSRFYNTMDPGWIFCERVIAHNLVTTNGFDNGFSISRGNQKVIASNLYAENCAAYGIWVAGFAVNGNSTDYGPENFAISNITAINCGLGGLDLDEAPRNGTISNIFIKGMLRGTPSGDFGDSNSGTGIRIGGSPSNDVATMSRLATNLEISNFVLIDCAKGGIMVGGSQDVTVRDGMIVNPGSANDYGGAPVADTSTSENFGIAARPGFTSKITRFEAHNVTVIDTRTTPLANYAIYLVGATASGWSNVRGVNTRRTGPSESLAYREFSGTVNFNNTVQHVVGTIAGSNSASGTMLALRANGAAGSRRVLGQGQTAGSARAEWAITGDAESGSNAGSNIALTTYSDAGVKLLDVFTVRRSDGRTTLAAPIQLKAYTTAGRPSAATMGAGAVVYDTTLTKPVYSDGAAWRDAAGTTV